MENKYNVILETSDLTYKAQGSTINDAIANLNLSWEHIKAKGLMTVTIGNKKSSLLIFPKQLKRIFANKIVRSLYAKRLEVLLAEIK